MIRRIRTLIKSNTFKQIVKYGLVGFVGFVIDFGLFWFLNDHLKMHYSFSLGINALVDDKFSIGTIDASISHIISSVLAIINNFILNSYFTFKITDQKIKRFFSFFGIASVGLVVSTFLLSFFMEIIGMPGLIAKFSSIVIVAMLQFGFNKFFTFKQ